MKLQDLFAQPDSWTKNYYAVNAQGNETDPEGSDATRWCLVGALVKCYGDGGNEYQIAHKRLLDLAREKLSQGIKPNIARSYSFGIVDFNDAQVTTIEDVRNLVAQADV